MLKKDARQRAILTLIEKNDIATQEELCELLEKEGFKATQATVSRDIRELSLSKMPSDKNGLKYVRIMSGSGAMEEKNSCLKDRCGNGYGCGCRDRCDAS